LSVSESVEKSTSAERPVRRVAAEAVEPPTELMQALSLEEDEEGEPQAHLLNRIIATLLERQSSTHECIEISNVTWRTARYGTSLLCPLVIYMILILY
jgi:hypothetical protein